MTNLPQFIRKRVYLSLVLGLIWTGFMVACSPPKTATLVQESAVETPSPSSAIYAEPPPMGWTSTRVETIPVLKTNLITDVKPEPPVPVKKLSRMYAEMSPDSAAAAISQLDVGLAIGILTNMNLLDSAAILEEIAQSGKSQAGRVALITEAMAQLKPREEK